MCLYAPHLFAEPLSPLLDQLSRAAIVKLVLEAIGPDGQALPMQPNVGHGVYISPDGLILTAAHVVFPPATWAPTATAYRLRIFAWDDANQTWGDGTDMDSGALAINVTHVKDLPVSDCRPSEAFPAMLCQRSRFERADDFVLIRDPRKSAPAYVDVIGPEEVVDRTQALKLNWRQFVVSEFHQDRLAAIDVQQVTSRTSNEIESIGGLQFIEGVSGSPLFIQTSQPVSSIFVAGVVVRRYKDDDPTFAAQPSNRAQVVLVPDIVDRTQSDLQKLSSNTPIPKCPIGTPSPYDAPLLFSYFATLRDLSDREFTSRCSCLEPFSTWQSTAAVVRFRRRNRATVTAAASSVEPADSVGGVIGLSKLSPSDDARLATFLAKAYDSHVDPLAVVHNEQDQLARRCAAPPCQVRACQQSCDPWDLSCVASRNSCEANKAMEHAQCETQRLITLQACEPETRVALAILARTITTVREAKISATDYAALRKTKFGSILTANEIDKVNYREQLAAH